MEKTPLTLNQALKLPCPDGFHVLDAEARSRMNFLAEGQGECLSDPQRHMLVSAAWKQIGTLPALILSDRDMAKQMEHSVRKAFGPFEYRAGGRITRTVGGRTAPGFCYCYTAQDTAMYGESVVLRSGKTLYYFHLYARESRKDESIPVWEALLAGSDWITR